MSEGGSDMFKELCRYLGITMEELNTAAQVFAALLALVALIIALIPPLRRWVVGAFYNTLNFLGFTRWAYREKFLGRYRWVRNIYLNRKEELDLRSTYIPLHVSRPDRAGRVPAVEVLGDPRERRILVVGDPGTGKTTLVKAFGTGILRPLAGLRAGDLLFVRRFREVPFLVELRHFASRQCEGLSLVQYLTDHVLRDQMKIRHGAAFLRRLLRQGRCLVLLDGLDEVGDEQYAGVRARIAAFCSGPSGDFETHRARVVMTCRKQNFERLRSDWIPGLFPEAVVLAPFNTDEVYAFLERRRHEFRDGRTPIKFFEQVQAAGMADLHRNPLVLTISLGLYLHVPKYQVPRSVAQFYEEMTKELLRRHDFRIEPTVEAVNRYNADDKFRFLREFALAMATRQTGFEEFSYREILDFYGSVADKIANVGPEDAQPFVREIIHHSGLLTRVSEDDTYVFAHRSIHEYFTALQVARSAAQGAGMLLERAGQLRWRQVIVFFASMDHDQVEPFLKELRGRNLELAGQCIPGAQVVSQALAEETADALVRDIRAGNAATALAALVSMTHSQRDQIRAMALTRVQQVLTEVLGGEVRQLRGLKEEDLVEVLGKLAITGSLEVVPVCLGLSRLIANATDTIGPLWHCLATAGIEQRRNDGRAIVGQLLDAVMTADGLAELQRQPAFAPEFATDELRAGVYPFRKAHPADSNLVTLLCWAERLSASRTRRNDFFIAKQKHREAWRTVERDRSRPAIRIHWHWVGLCVSGAAVVLPPILVSFALLRHGWGALLAPGESAWWLALYCPSGTAAFVLWLILSLRIGGRLGIASYDQYSGHVVARIFPALVDVDKRLDSALMLWIVVGAPSFLSMFWRMLLTDLSRWLYLPLSMALTILVYGLPASEFCGRGSYTYLRKPNPALGIYEDPRSRHWVEVPR